MYIWLYNLIAHFDYYSDNDSETPGNLLLFKRDESLTDDGTTNSNSSSFKHKSSILGKVTTSVGNDRVLKISSCSTEIFK